MRFTAIAVLLAVCTTGLSQTPERIFVRILVLADRESLQGPLEDLAGGTPFRDLATAASRHSSGPRGGYLGELRIAVDDPVLVRAAAGLAPGHYSDPFEYEGSWALLFREPGDFRQRAYALEDRALDLLQRGKPTESIPLLEDALDLYPDFIHGYLTLGNAYNRVGEASLEETCYREAIRIAPEFYQAHYDLGALLFGVGRAEEAIASFDRALQIKPDLVRAYVNLSTIYRSLGRTEDAKAAADQAITNDPLLPAAHYVQGAALLDEDPQRSLGSFEVAALLDPGNPGFGYTVATTLARLGRLGDARDHLQDLIDQFPDFGPAKEALNALKGRGSQ